MNIMKKLALGMFLGLAFSCGPQERVSKDVFDAVNKKMEVKKLSEAEILQEAMIWGDSISEQAQSQLISNLQNAIAEQGVAEAVEYCKINATSILDSVALDDGIIIRRVSNRFRNPDDQPNEEEEQLLEAYEYNSEQGIESDPNIQKFENGEVYLYTKAIVISKGLCLSCHGNQNTEIEGETLEKINALYPDDKATGHQMGDLRGMWSIRIPKKAVVDRM